MPDSATPLPIPPPAPMPGESPSRAPTSAVEIVMGLTLSRLDAAIDASARERRRHVVSRILGGISSHFRTRVSEWFTTALLLQFGLILYGPGDVFPTAPNLAVMAQWASEETWGRLCLVIGGSHLLALIVNGTFPGFRYSPHVRLATSFLAVFAWFQITLAIFMSGIGGTGLGTYRLILLLELWNVVRAGIDVGAVHRRRSPHGR